MTFAQLPCSVVCLLLILSSCANSQTSEPGQQAKPTYPSMSSAADVEGLYKYDFQRYGLINKFLLKPGLSQPEAEREKQEQIAFIKKSGLPATHYEALLMARTMDWAEADKRYIAYKEENQGNPYLATFRNQMSQTVLSGFALLADTTAAAKPKIAYYLNDYLKTTGTNIVVIASALKALKGTAYFDEAKGNVLRSKGAFIELMNTYKRAEENVKKLPAQSATSSATALANISKIRAYYAELEDLLGGVD